MITGTKYVNAFLITIMLRSGLNIGLCSCPGGGPGAPSIKGLCQEIIIRSLSHENRAIIKRLMIINQTVFFP
ncbi:MAG TPA: hypothetical protein PK269_08325, partial [Bacteroidales bacterium]|nr:hypothetical protein [Bacteroidales bacterium]